MQELMAKQQQSTKDHCKLTHDLEKRMQELDMKIDREIMKNRNNDLNVKQSLSDFNALLRHFEKTTKEVKIQANVNEREIKELWEVKLDTMVHEELSIMMNENIENNKRKIMDNYHNMLATDNYIEKYLPFKI